MLFMYVLQKAPLLMQVEQLLDALLLEGRLHNE